MEVLSIAEMAAITGGNMPNGLQTAQGLVGQVSNSMQNAAGPTVGAGQVVEIVE